MRRSIVSSRSVWKIGWVITISAPAAFLRSSRWISLSRSAAPGSKPVARRNDVWPPGNGLPAGSMPRFMLRRHLEQPDRVEVVDRGRLRVVADLGRIAGDDDQVADADGVGAEQVRHLAEQVPVAAAHVQDRLDPVALEQQRAEGQVRHARHGARARRRRSRCRRRWPGASWRPPAPSTDRARARGSPRPRPRTCRRRSWPRSRCARPAAWRPSTGTTSAAAYRARPGDLRAPVAEHARRLGHPADVIGRGAAAAADHRGAELDGAAREHVEVLRRGHVEQAAVDGARQPGVGLHAERHPRPAHALGDGQRELRAVAAVHADHVGAPVAQRRRRPAPASTRRPPSRSGRRPSRR